jgi:hypothetical protein
MEAERVRALGALHSLRSQKKLAAERRKETNYFNNKEKEKWIDNCKERETAVARKRVEDTETALKQEQADIASAESEGLTAREPGRMFQEMLDAIGDSLSDLASSDDKEDGHGDEDTEQGKPSEDDEPGWVMGTISKTVQQHMERFPQKQMKCDELTQPGWGDAANYFHERDKRYSTTELKVLAIVKSHTDDDAAHPPPLTFGKLIQSLDIIFGKLQMPEGTSRPGSSHLRLGSRIPQSNKRIVSLPPKVEPDSSLINTAKPIEPVIIYPSIVRSS